jgi:hypothetical protein
MDRVFATRTNLNKDKLSGLRNGDTVINIG